MNSQMIAFLAELADLMEDHDVEINVIEKKESGQWICDGIGIDHNSGAGLRGSTGTYSCIQMKKCFTARSIRQAIEEDLR